MPSEHLSSHSTFPTGTFIRGCCQPALECLSPRAVSAFSHPELAEMEPGSQQEGPPPASHMKIIKTHLPSHDSLQLQKLQSTYRDAGNREASEGTSLRGAQPCRPRTARAAAGARLGAVAQHQPPRSAVPGAGHSPGRTAPRRRLQRRLRLHPAARTESCRCHRPRSAALLAPGACLRLRGNGDSTRTAAREKPRRCYPQSLQPAAGRSVTSRARRRGS